MNYVWIVTHGEPDKLNPEHCFPNSRKARNFAIRIAKTCLAGVKLDDAISQIEFGYNSIPTHDNHRLEISSRRLP